MDRLSIFAAPTAVTLISKTGKTLDSVTEGLDAITKETGRVLRQLEATHLGHEEEDWNNEYPVEETEEFENGEV